MTTSWGNTTRGGGSNPSNFTTAGDIFIIESGTTMTATATWSVGAGLTTSSTLQINSGGTLAMSSYLLTLNSCNFSNSGTFSGSGGVTIAGTLASHSIAGFTTTGDVSMTKTGGTATFQGNVSAGSLIVNGAGGTLNLGSALSHTFSGDVTLTAGSLNGGASIMSLTSLTTNWSGTGSNFDPGTGTISLQATTTTIETATKFYKLLINSNKSVNVTGGDITLINELRLNSGASLTMNTYKMIEDGSALLIAGVSSGTIYTSNSSSSPFPSSKTWPQKISYMSVTNATIVSGTYNSSPGLQLNSSTATLSGNITSTIRITLSGAGTDLNLSSYTANIGNDIRFQTGSETLSTASGTINFFGLTEATTFLDKNPATPQVFNNLTISGSGIKYFHTGETTINGTLSMEGSATATVSGTLTYGANATLQYKGSSAQTTGPEFPATFSGSGGVIINNSSGVSLNEAKTISKTLLLSTGSLNMGNKNLTVGSLFGSGDLTHSLGTATNTILTIGGDNSNCSYSGILSNGTSSSLSLVKTGTGILTLSGTNTYSGATTVSAGTLKLGAAGVIADGSALSVASGATFDLSGFSETVGSISGVGTITSSAAGTPVLTGGGDNTSTTFSGVLQNGSATSVSLTKSGSATMTLSGANTYTGTTTVNAGTLKAGSTSAFGSNSPVSLTNTSGAIIDLNNNNISIGSLTGGGASGGTVNLGSGQLSVGGDNSSPNPFAGIIEGSGSIIKAGTGISTLSGPNTYSGLTTVSSGTLNIQHATALGSISQGTFVSSGASLQLQGGIAVGSEGLTISGNGTSPAGALDNISGDNTWGGTITLGAASIIRNHSGYLTINNPNAIDLKSYQLILTGNTSGGGAGIISGIISSSTGGGSLRKINSAGTWSLSAANTFTGGVKLQAGRLNINNSQALGTSAGTFTIETNDGNIIDNTSGASITTVNYPISIDKDFTFTGSNNLNLGTGAVTMSVSPTITTTANTLTIGGAISNSNASITKAGAGGLAFGANAITIGSLTINTGTVTSTTATLTVSGDLINNGIFNHNSGLVNLAGGNSNIGGTGALIFKNLTLNTQSSSNIKSLTSNASVAGTLLLTNGRIFSSYPSSLLTVENGASITGYSDNSMIVGSLKVIGTGLSPYTVVYPLAGTKHKYLQLVTITYREQSSADYFTVTHYDNAHSSINSRTQAISAVSDREYWDISPGEATKSKIQNPNQGVTLSIAYKSDDNSNYISGKTSNYFVLGHFNQSSMWEAASGSSVTRDGSEPSGVITMSDVMNFSPFAIASTEGVAPVTLTNFNARLTPENKVALSWATASESVNKGFRIERQYDLGESKFNNIGFVPTKAIGGNSAQLLNYNFTDIAPKLGSTSYYRLVQEDIDGKLTNSEVRMVRLNGQSVSLVYPNPSKGDFLISRTADGKKMNVQVTDISGRIIKQINGIESATHKLYIDHPGIYNIKLTYPETGEQSIQRVIVH